MGRHAARADGDAELFRGADCLGELPTLSGCPSDDDRWSRAGRAQRRPRLLRSRLRNHLGARLAAGARVGDERGAAVVRDAARRIGRSRAFPRRVHPGCASPRATGGLRQVADPARLDRPRTDAPDAGAVACDLDRSCFGRPSGPLALSARHARAVCRTGDIPIGRGVRLAWVRLPAPRAAPRSGGRLVDPRRRLGSLARGDVVRA